MMFSFSENPYFRNDIVIKDYELSIIGMYGHRLWGVAWTRYMANPVLFHIPFLQDTKSQILVQ